MAKKNTTVNDGSEYREIEAYTHDDKKRKNNPKVGIHDIQYRAQNCCQQSSYNQPPHVSFYLGSDAPLPARPNVVINGRGAVQPPAVTEPVVTEPVVLSGKYVRDMNVKDAANASGWKLSDQPAEVGSVVFGDRDYTYTAMSD